jgi:hypothetical protein
MCYNERNLKCYGQVEDRDKVAMTAAFEPSRTLCKSIEATVNTAAFEACVEPVLLLSLPANSPDFSPIEERCSKVKVFLRKATT